MKVSKKISNLSIAIMFDTRTKLKNGNYPFRLRITLNRERFYFKTSLEATEELYARAYGERKKADAKELFEQIEAIKNMATNICDFLPAFTPEAFRREFYKEATSTIVNDVFSAFENYSRQLEAENRIGTAKSYIGAAHSIAAFCNGKLLEHKQSKATGKKKPITKFPKLKFEEITVQWLKRYATALESVGSSRSTIGLYCRSLRTIYNEAITKDASLRKMYPFGKGKFEIPTSTKNKRALSKSEIRSLMDYIPQNNQEQLARDLWLLSYLLSGANIADLVKLRYEQITNSNSGITVLFEREKTKRKAEQTTIKVNLPPSATPLFQQIIAEHGNRTKSGYVFPFMNDKTTAQDQWNAKTHLIRRINLSLRKIGTLLQLPMNLTTYTARHSFATVLLRSGAPIAYISQSLGHSNIGTTENYLGAFDDEQSREFTANLLNF